MGRSAGPRSRRPELSLEWPGKLGTDWPARRYPVHFDDDTRGVLTEKLGRLARPSSYFDRAWIVLNARRFDGDAVAAVLPGAPRTDRVWDGRAVV